MTDEERKQLITSLKKYQGYAGYDRRLNKMIHDAADEIERLAALAQSDAWKELNDVAVAIGSNRFLDPPDGGSVSFAEQVTRMRQALEKAETAQSDAEPVDRAYSDIIENYQNGIRPIGLIDEYFGFSSMTTPPRPDAFAGLIEAADYLIDRLRAALLGKVVRDLGEAIAAYESARARAADRSGK